MRVGGEVGRGDFARVALLGGALIVPFEGEFEGEGLMRWCCRPGGDLCSGDCAVGAGQVFGRGIRCRLFIGRPRWCHLAWTVIAGEGSEDGVEAFE